MKTFALFAIFLVAFAHADSNESASLEEEDVKELAQYVKDKFNSTIIFDLIKLAKKAQEKCPDIEEKMGGAIDQTYSCISEIELGSETFCSLIRNNWAKCSKPSLEAIASCLPEESKELPTMMGKIVLALVDEACNSTVEQILELFNPCQLKGDLSKYTQCTDFLKVFKESQDKLPSKSLVCSMVPKMKSCAKAQQEATCQNPITRQANTQFYEAIEDATKDDCDSLNKT